jgi:Zn-dependent peptidase ImmA (M78 family)
MKDFKVEVNPEIIKWARESSGYTLEYISKKLNLPTQEYKKIETGEEKISFKKLQKLANIIKRPISVFLLPKIPNEPSPKLSFRIIPNTLKDTQNNIDPELILTIRKAKYYQSIANELIKDLNLENKISIPNFSLKDDPAKVANQERERIGIPITEQKKFKDEYQAFNKWREIIENQNILVFQFSFPIEQSRGFVIVEKNPPVIVINTKDYILAKIFTLFHEYAHILLRISEIYSEEALNTQNQENKEIETWCNKFASEFLLPKSHFINEYNFLVNKKLSLEDLISKLSTTFKVSKQVVLMKLKEIELIDDDEYREQINKLPKMYKELGKYRFTKSKKDVKFRKCIQERGKKFISLIFSAKEKGLITTADAIEYLSLKLNDLNKLESSLEA